MKIYKKIIFPTGSQTASEILMAELEDEGFYAFEIEDGYLTGYIEDQVFEGSELAHLLQEKTGIQIESIPEENWNEQWEKSFEPVIIDDFVGIRAHFHPTIIDVQYEIIITLQMSFGTGHHPTTALMISEMRKLDFRKKDVIDFGTGTGILAILASKLGAGSVAAIDNEEWSVENAKENVLKNHCDNIAILKGSNLDNTSTADIILANINSNILLQHVRPLTDHLKAGGTIILSGFLSPDSATLQETFEKSGLSFNSGKKQNDWMVLSFQKT